MLRVSSEVEQSPDKRPVTGSIPVPSTKVWTGSSVVERGTFNLDVVGSTPTRFSKIAPVSNQGIDPVVCGRRRVRVP